MRLGIFPFINLLFSIINLHLVVYVCYTHGLNNLWINVLALQDTWMTKTIGFFKVVFIWSLIDIHYKGEHW